MTDEEKFRRNEERKTRKQIIIAIAIHTLVFIGYLPRSDVKSAFILIALAVITGVWYEMPKKP